MEPRHLKTGGLKPIRSFLVLATVAVLILAGWTLWQRDMDNEDENGEVSFPDVDIQYVSDIRELKALRDIPSVVVDPEEMSDIATRNLSEDELHMLQHLFEILLLWDQGDGDLADAFDDFARSDVAGLYVPEDRAMYVTDRFSEGLTSKVLVHEYTHALQDQHFDLSSFMEGNTTDSTMALRCLVEGDATLVADVQYYYSLSDRQRGVLMEEMEDLYDGQVTNTPYALWELMTFPYMEGLEFTIDIHQHEGWEGVDSVFLKPPLSTEQVIHPEKYRDDEAPIPAQPGVPPEGAREVSNDRMGEFMVSIFLGHHMDRDHANKGAEGWGGDQMVIYEGEDGATLAEWSLVWDTDRDAWEFSRAMEQLVEITTDPVENPDIHSCGDFFFSWERQGRGHSIIFAENIRDLEDWRTVRYDG